MLATLILSISPALLQAQHHTPATKGSKHTTQSASKPSQKNRFTIKGVVWDSDLNESVPYSTITVHCFNASGKSVGNYSQVTSDKGEFIITLPEASSYLFEARFVGMICPEQRFTRKQMNQQTPMKIFLKTDTHQLDAVTVKANKQLVRIEADRLSYNVEDDLQSLTESASDMLKRVPLITVDGEGNLQVKGSSNFTIYVNGKPSPLMEEDAAETLKAMQASDIKKIEVITSPGVEFDSEGTEAIINIVTASGLHFTGAKGSVTAGLALPRPRPRISANTTLAFNKLSVNASANVRYVHDPLAFAQVSKDVRTSTNLLQTEESKNLSSNFLMQVYRLSLNYELNPRNLFALETSFRSHNILNNTTSSIISQQRPNEPEPFASTKQLRNFAMHNGSFQMRLDYQYTTDTPGEQLGVSYLWSNIWVNTNRPSEQWSLLSNKSLDNYQAYINLNSSKQNFHIAQVDYVRPFLEQHKINLGGKWVMRKGFSQTGNAYAKNLEQARVQANNALQPALYNQNVYSLYAAYTFGWRKLAFNGGVRFEAGDIANQYPAQSQRDYNYRFADFVPRLLVSYVFSPKEQLKLTYAMRVRRPSLRQMNPYEDRSRFGYISMGNPTLTNAKRHHLQLEYSYLSPKLNITASVEENYHQNPIQQYTYLLPDGSNTIVNTYLNTGFNSFYKLFTYISYTPVHWLTANVNLSYTYGIMDLGKSASDNKMTDFSIPSRRTDWGANASANIMFRLPKNWSINAYANFNRFFFNYYLLPTYYYEHSITVRKGFRNNKYNLSLMINNPLEVWHTTKRTTIAQGYTIDSQIREYRFGATLTFTYNFGKLKHNSKSIKKGILDDDPIED